MSRRFYSFRYGLIMVVIAAFLGPSAAMFAQSTPRTAAMWQRIYYPRLEIPTGNGETCTVLVGSGSHDQKPSLHFDVLWSGRNSVKPPDAIMQAGRISVRLHLLNGTTVEPKNNTENSPSGAGRGGGMTYSRIYFFPWGANTLDEAWFEFRVDNRTYWTEVPYGFVRDPLAALAPSDPKAGPPALAPAMKGMPPEDRIVPWEKIDYDLGPIQNGWRLLVELANPFDANCLVTLYREDGKWELTKPRTSVKIVADRGGTLDAEQVGVRITDPFRRMDEYSFARYPRDGRDWGTLTISVDGKSNNAVIPSSLFKYTHGVADSSHSQRIRIPAQR